MDYFFLKPRLRLHPCKGPNFIEWLESDALQKPYNQRRIQYHLDEGKPLHKAQYATYRMFSGSGSLSAFPPIVAKRIYQHFKPTRILDPCAGWGGRCLAAMALNINYIGFDTNESLLECYSQMFDTYASDSAIEISCEDSSVVDYTKYIYDFVFTSPPYFKGNKPIERYEGMPGYSSTAEFNERFLHPMLRGVWAGLSAGGHCALNIPLPMLADVEAVLGPTTEVLPLQKRRRSADDTYKEYIYVWQKV